MATAILSNAALDRVYVGVHWSAILIYPDSVSLGLAAAPGHRSKPPPATVQRAANVRLADSGPWYDITGRRVATQIPANGKLGIGPGVYICPRPGRAAAKIVVVR